MSTDSNNNGDDPFSGLDDDWDDLFDALHEPDEADPEAELAAVHQREQRLAESGARVLDPSQYVFESDAGISVEVEAPEPPAADQPAPEVAPEPVAAAAAEPEVAPEPVAAAAAEPDVAPAPEGEGEAEAEAERTPVPGGEPIAEVERTPVPGGEPTPIPEDAPAVQPAVLEQASRMSEYADPMLTQTGVGGESRSDGSPAPLPKSPFEPSVDELDDLLDFDGHAEALGDLLGAPPPLPPPDPEAAERASRGVVVPPASVSTSLADEIPAADDVPVSDSSPGLAPAPTDDELFGDLPDELPDDVKPMTASPGTQATRVVDAAALDEIVRSAGEEGEGAADQHQESTRIADMSALTGLVAESAKPTPTPVAARKRGPAIVRRDVLERRRREQQDSDFGSDVGDFSGAEATRIADVAAIDELARSEAEAAKAAAEAAEAFFAEEAESLDLALDEDFYDDIEIGDGDAETEAVPVPVPIAPSKRRTAHIVRRAVTERPAPPPSESAPVVELEADYADRSPAPPGPPVAVVDAGTIDLDGGEDSDDGVLTSSAAPPPEPAVPDIGVVAVGEVEHEPSPVTPAVADLELPGGEAVEPGMAAGEVVEVAELGGASLELGAAGGEPAAPEAVDGDALELGAPGAAPAEPMAPMQPTAPALVGTDELELGAPGAEAPAPEATAVEPADAEAADRAATEAEEPAAVFAHTGTSTDWPVGGVSPGEPAELAEVDVAPELPAGVFGTSLPELALESLALPAQVGPADDDRSEEWASQLLVYEREIETIDEPGPLSRLRVEAGRLCERLGDLDLARAHYEQALVADPRALPAMRGLRRVERAMGRWADAVMAIDNQLPFSSSMEQRALEAHRADLLLAAGEQDLARVAVGQLLDTVPSDARALLAELELCFVDGREEELAATVDRLAVGVEDRALSGALRGLSGRLAERRHDAAAALASYRGAQEDDMSVAGWARLRLALMAADGGEALTEAWANLLPADTDEFDAPLAAAVLWRRAEAARTAGDGASAAQLLAEASSASQDPVVANAAARAIEASGDLATAARAWIASAGASADPAAQAGAYRRAGRCLAELSPSDAAEALRRVIAVDPGDAASSAALELVLASAGDDGALLEIDRQAVVADAGAVPERVRLALRLVGLERVDEAVDVLRAGITAARAADQEPSPALVDTLARVLGSRGDYAGRVQLLAGVADSEVRSVAPVVAWRRAARAAESLALASWHAHQIAQYDNAEMAAAAGEQVNARLRGALELWQRAIDFEPESRSAHVAAIRLAETLGDPDILENVLLVAQAAERHPAAVVSTALRRVSLLLGRADPDVAGAEDVLREADALAPGDPRATLPQYILAAGADRWTDAAQVIEERAAQLGDGREAQALRYRAGAILLDRGDDPGRAAELLAAVTASLPGFGAGAELLASAHRRLGDASALAQDLGRASGIGADVQGARGDRFALLVREAELYEFKVGDPGKAVDIYAKALRMRPGDPLARHGFVRAAEAAGEAAPVAELALADLKHAEETGDARARADAYEELARIDGELRGDPASALLSWEQAAAAAPERYGALRVLERTYASEQRAEDLLALYGKQLNTLGDSHDVVGVAFSRARLAETLGRGEAEVMANYRRALDVDRSLRLALFRLETVARQRGPSDELAQLEQGIADYFADDPRARASFLTRAGETRMQLDQIDLAADAFKAAAQLVTGGHWPAVLALWRAALKGELWIDAAEAILQEASMATTDQSRAEAYHLAGAVLMDKALNSERATDCFRRLLAVDPTHKDGFLRLRILFDEQGQHEDLAQLLRQRLEVETDDSARVELMLALADLHRNFLDDRDTAVDQLRGVLAIDPDHRGAISALSDMAWEKGDWAAAAESLIARARVESEPAVLKQIFYRLGTIYTDRMPDPRLAMRSFQKVLSYDDNDHGALAKISELAVELGDWSNALAACERLIKAAPNSPDSIVYWHRVARVYLEGMDNRHRAEQALRRALDLDPTSDLALSKLIEFFADAGDKRSMRVHLDKVMAAMRRRLGEKGLDAVAFRVLARALEAREQAGVAGSLATARCAAELAVVMGGADEREQRLAAHATQIKPPVAGLGKPTFDDSLLFPHAVSGELRQVMAALGERLAKHVGVDLKRHGVGRSDRQKGTPQANMIAEVSNELGAGEAELYVSTRNPRLFVIEATQPVSIVVGSEILENADAAALRFMAGSAAKLSMGWLTVLARLGADEAGVMLAALVQQFVPEFKLKGVPADAVTAEAQKMKRLIPASLQQELRPFVLGLAGSRLDHNKVWAGIVAGGNRAGLLAAGSIAGAVGVLSRAGGHRDLASAVRDPMIGDLVRFSVSEEHALLRGTMGG